MPDLVVDFVRLERARARAEAALLDLEAARCPEELAELVGHPRLAATVRAFRDAWAIRRERLAERILELRAAVIVLRESYAIADGRLAGATGSHLTGGPGS
ncbi:MAG: hypothetical protein BGO95_02690 [Micrococcales bacterium 73-13]|nr:MAG: hypothetical protein BGO95_02690 [Micrococcales bacterium 73-13]